MWERACRSFFTLSWLPFWVALLHRNEVTSARGSDRRVIIGLPMLMAPGTMLRYVISATMAVCNRQARLK